MKVIPLHLDFLRHDLSRNRQNISLPNQITHPRKLLFYSLDAEFQAFHPQLQESKLERESDHAYAALFLRFAVQGVAQLAELAHPYLNATLGNNASGAS